MRITNVRFGRVVAVLSITLLALFLFLLSHFTFHASTANLLNGVSQKFHHWFQKTVFDHNWEDIHCRKRLKNETHVNEKWVEIIGGQLNIKDEQAVFDCNTGCNEWLLALRKRYPKLKIGGAHTDQYAVEYAQKIFNDTSKTFGVISKDKGKLDFVESLQYDHAIDYGGLRELSKEVQCRLVRELMRIVKPGGSIYLGHNMEDNECKVMDKFSGFVTLPGCYWAKCLKERTDIAEIYYIKESDLYEDPSQIDSCYTAVFIHKNVLLNRGQDSPKGIKAKYKEHPNKYICTPKQIFDHTQQALMEVKKISLNPRNIGHSLKKYSELSKSKNVNNSKS